MIIALAQINPTAGDLRGNGRKILQFAREAAEAHADLVVFPELSVTGYPPQDLLDNGAFMDAVEETVGWIAAEAPSRVGMLVGAPVRNTSDVGKRLFNSALLLADGTIAGRADKSLLPTYDIYDEYRYFEPAAERSCIEFRGMRLGVHICEDMWNMEEGAAFQMYAGNPLDELARDGADVLIGLSATPFARGKADQRHRLVEGICRYFSLPLVMVNQIGANAELVFDGASSVHGPDGSLLLQAPSFEEALTLWNSNDLSASVRRGRSEVEDVRSALVLGIRDYIRKTGAFEKAIVGISGGIDSALTCTLAVEALGADRVVGVSMPSEFTSRESVEDARLLAKNLEVELLEIPIQQAFDTFRGMLGHLFEQTPPGTAEENLQARSRGTTLMAIANKFNYLLLTTGNKSELAVGYVTLYGDMAGGLAVLADVFKTQVYALAEHLNERAGRDLIPRNILEKAPSAELRPNQTDQDTLPPYDVLDSILQCYIEELKDLDDIAERTGQDPELVLQILRMVDRNEHKRRQAPPALRVTTKAFGMGRRLPLVMRWERDPIHHPA